MKKKQMKLIDIKKLEESRIRALQSKYINGQNLLINEDNLTNFPAGHTTDV